MKELTTCHFKLTLPQTERVGGEEHDHRVTSRINLVDLAGSERCGPAGTSGQQLKVRAPFPGLGRDSLRLQTKCSQQEASLSLGLAGCTAGV